MKKVNEEYITSKKSIRKLILEQSEPFTIGDIIHSINADASLIVQVLNEVYNEGLLEYKKAIKTICLKWLKETFL